MTSESPTISYRPWLFSFSVFVFISVLILILFGALVKSHDAGLAVPDWPTSFGENMFLFPPSQWTGGIFYEHVHRLIASGVGFLTLILSFWLFFVDPRRIVKIVAVLSLLAVILQGILGGLTVRFLLPTIISVAHGVLAQTFMLMVLWLCYSQSKHGITRWRKGEVTEGNSKLFNCGVVLTVAIFIQLILGAVMRHKNAGLAVLDFPTMAGHLIPIFSSAVLEEVNQIRTIYTLPPVTYWQYLAHIAHRIGGFLVAIVAILFFFRTRFLSSKESRARSISWAILFLIVVQFTLGVLAVLTIREPFLTSSHVFFGAVLLSLAAFFCFTVFPSRGRASS